MTPPILAFDIETIPDVEALRRHYGISSQANDEEAVEMVMRILRQEKNTNFLPLPYHQVAVISGVLRRFDSRDESVKIFSLAPPEYDEAGAVEMFYKIIGKYTPRLASWNGGGFDLPVLHYRAMKHGVQAGCYWNVAGADSSGDKFRWNNYFNRYHERHLDLMDTLGMYQPRAWTGLESMAQLCGLPGKIGVGGAGVWAAWQRGDTEAVRHYCEADALLTYLLFVRFQYFRGEWDDTATEEKLIRDYLLAEPLRWQEFLAQWPAADFDLAT